MNPFLYERNSPMENESDQEIYESYIIRRRVKRILGDDQSIEEFVGPEYARDVTECLNIVDIGYTVTAIGILGRSLELCIKEYCKKKLKSKTYFNINTANKTISQIKKVILSASHANRICLLQGQKITIDHKDYRLKKKLLKDEYYWLLDSIRDARNKAFHGCDNDYYNELSAKVSLMEQGMVLLVTLIKAFDDEIN